mmetsp:Transcript_31211/g.89458  ORF Transcript_31211/g.89458 Transcript_31211/m.89458 type:complete len:328 (-) Transcript_31211:257-1240(-)
MGRGVPRCEAVVDHVQRPQGGQGLPNALGGVEEDTARVPLAEQEELASQRDGLPGRRDDARHGAPEERRHWRQRLPCAARWVETLGKEIVLRGNHQVGEVPADIEPTCHGCCSNVLATRRHRRQLLPLAGRRVQALHGLVVPILLLPSTHVELTGKRRGRSLVSGHGHRRDNLPGPPLWVKALGGALPAAHVEPSRQGDSLSTGASMLFQHRRQLLPVCTASGEAVPAPGLPALLGLLAVQILFSLRLEFMVVQLNEDIHTTANCDGPGERVDGLMFCGRRQWCAFPAAPDVVEMLTGMYAFRPGTEEVKLHRAQQVPTTSLLSIPT